GIHAERVPQIVHSGMPSMSLYPGSTGCLAECLECVGIRKAVTVAIDEEWCSTWVCLLLTPIAPRDIAPQGCSGAFMQRHQARVTGFAAGDHQQSRIEVHVITV